jgi:hypothetical protein
VNSAGPQSSTVLRPPGSLCRSTYPKGPRREGTATPATRGYSELPEIQSNPQSRLDPDIDFGEWSCFRIVFALELQPVACGTGFAERKVIIRGSLEVIEAKGKSCSIRRL